jgi:hypothetical protein
MATSFRIPKHEQDEMRTELVSLAQPHRATANELQMSEELDQNLDVFKSNLDQHHRMMETTRLLPAVAKLVRKYKDQKAVITQQMKEATEAREEKLKAERRELLKAVIEE